MADTGCEWLIGLYLISTGFRTSSSKNALTRFGRASRLVSISQAENVIHALKPMVTSVASSLRTQPEYKPNSVTNRPWDLKNFGWVEEISFTPPKTLYLGGGGLIFLLI